MGFKLRDAVQADMDSVLKLIKELATFENEPDAVELTTAELKEDGFGKDPAFQVFVAEINDEIVGMALFYQRYSTWKGKSIHLEDLVVQQNHRNKGIGNALYSRVMKYAYDNNFNRVAWEVLDWNKVAIDYYKSTGAEVFEEWRVAQMNAKELKQFVVKTSSS